jgi:phosphoglycolate phosphatase
LKTKAVIFDLDGTLIDSIKDIALSTNEVLEKLGHKTHQLHAYQKFVGDGALTLLTNALPSNSNEKTINEALILFKEIYGDTIHKYTKPYTGIYKMLDMLNENNLKLSVLSNKPHQFTVEFIEHFFKNYPFLEVHGQKENIPKKPHPQGIFNIAEALDIPISEIIFVGDTPTDIKTAQSADMTSIGVSWGYRSANELVSSGATYIAKTPKHLAEIILKNNF